MAKLKLDEVTAEDLEAYVETISDFAFEQRVFARLVELRFEAKHNGTYSDPVTGKPREFDIRATMSLTDRIHQKTKFQIFLAVECKNIGKNSPLLVATVPRGETESFHEFFLVQKVGDGVKDPTCKRTRVERQLYGARKPVGKDCHQVGRLQSNGELSGDDRELYDKWSQAISSAHDLADDATRHNDKELNMYDQATAVFPVVVVPDSTLWTVAYDGKGKITASPKQVDHVEYFVGAEVVRNGVRVMQISHLHFCTLSGIDLMLDNLSTDHPTDSLFPSGYLK